MKKVLIAAAIAVIVIGGLGLALWLAPNAQQANESTQSAETLTTTTPQDETDEQPAAGRYVAYTEDEIAADGYAETILFFHAPWCPECRAFEAAINDSSIPAGVQIMKVDYDSNADLKQKHGVTLQSTFVSVNDAGELVTKWVGYGKDKSVEAILGNT